MSTEKKRTQQQPREPRPSQLFVGLPEIAWMLGCSYDWVVRAPRGLARAPRDAAPLTNMDLLIRDYGFPKPRDFPGQRHWSRKKVQQWIDEERDLTEIKKPAPSEPDYDAMLEQRNADIERRSA